MLKKSFVFLIFIALICLIIFNNGIINVESVVLPTKKSSGNFSVVLSNKNYSNTYYAVLGKDYNEIELLKKLHAKKVCEEVVGDIVSYYYYSNCVGCREIVNGKAVNIHVAKTKDKTVIGFPIIYGGF